MGRWKIYKIPPRVDSALRYELFSANIRTERNRIIRKVVLPDIRKYCNGNEIMLILC